VRGGAWRIADKEFFDCITGHVSSHSAPLLLLHSRTDPIAPFGQATEMEKRYRLAGRQHTNTAMVRKNRTRLPFRPCSGSTDPDM
jgi:hypothetical protein